MAGPRTSASRTPTSCLAASPSTLRKAAFLGQVARARVGPANPWLARGRMMPPPVVEAAAIEPEWYAYNAGQDHSMYDTRGTMRVPSVLVRAWQLDGRHAWLAANVSDTTQHARVDGVARSSYRPATSASWNPDHPALERPWTASRPSSAALCPACRCSATAPRDAPPAGTARAATTTGSISSRARRRCSPTSRAPVSCATSGSPSRATNRTSCARSCSGRGGTARRSRPSTCPWVTSSGSVTRRRATSAHCRSR